MTAKFRIYDLAQEFGVTIRTIRHYEEQGLLTPAREGSHRMFSARDRARLKLALRGKRLGFALRDIKELFDLHDLARDERPQLEAFAAKLEKRKQMLEQQREDLEVLLNEVQFFTRQCERGLRCVQKSGTTHDHLRKR